MSWSDTRRFTRIFVALALAGCAVDEGRAFGVARREVARDERDSALGRPGQQLGRRVRAVDDEGRFRLQEQAQLGDRHVAGAGDDDAASAEIDEDGVVTH